MTVDVEGARRRFLVGLLEEEVSSDTSGHEVGRFVRSTSVDVDAATAVVRRGTTDEEPVRLEVGLDALAAAWPGLVAAGEEALRLGADERNGAGRLRVMIDEAVDGEPFESDDPVLTTRGTFEARREPHTSPAGSRSSSAG